MTPPGSCEIEPYLRDAAEAQFARLYADFGRDVLAYALPRAAGPEDAADVVAETFLVAWRRAREVPDGPEARLWLFGVARRVLANQRRSESRRTRLGERLRNEVRAMVPTQAEPDTGERAVLRALSRLGDDDRELLLLAGWEELKSPQIARVLGISSVAARTRLHRARRRLRTELAEEEGAPGAVPCTDELRFEEGR
jgi:RNA polymerase sigma factor (sigma-70 family)